MLVFWGLVVIGVVALMRGVSDRGAPDQASRSDAPMEILRRRYAAGKLTKEQFQEMKRHVA